jgi:hypothetical protein
MEHKIQKLLFWNDFGRLPPFLYNNLPAKNIQSHENTKAYQASCDGTLSKWTIFRRGTREGS